jgi:hypothetical protein
MTKSQEKFQVFTKKVTFFAKTGKAAVTNDYGGLMRSAGTRARASPGFIYPLPVRLNIF